MVELSSADRKILLALQEQGDISSVELAGRAGMSPSPCLRKVGALPPERYIRHDVAALDRRKPRFKVVAYVEVKVPQIADAGIVDRFREAVMNEPAIVECSITSGPFDFMLKVVAESMEHYAKFLTGTLLKMPGVRDTQSTFVLDTFKQSATPADLGQGVGTPRSAGSMF